MSVCIVDLDAKLFTFHLMCIYIYFFTRFPARTFRSTSSDFQRDYWSFSHNYILYLRTRVAQNIRQLTMVILTVWLYISIQILLWFPFFSGCFGCFSSLFNLHRCWSRGANLLCVQGVQSWNKLYLSIVKTSQNKISAPAWYSCAVIISNVIDLFRKYMDYRPRDTLCINVY